MIKRTSGSGVNSVLNYQLANELHKQIIRKFKRKKVYSSFRESNWGVDLADIELIYHWANTTKESSIYCVKLIFLTNIHGLFFWKTKEELILVMNFKKILDSLKRKPNKIWVDQGGKFYNNFLKRFLEINSI